MKQYYDKTENILWFKADLGDLGVLIFTMENARLGFFSDDDGDAIEPDIDWDSAEDVESVWYRGEGYWGVEFAGEFHYNTPESDGLHYAHLIYNRVDENFLFDNDFDSLDWEEIVDLAENPPIAV